MKAFKAYSKHGHVTADTAKDAATKFFVTFPSARKCDIVEGETDGDFFVVKYGNRFSASGMPQSWKDVTKKTLGGIEA
jgi:hypothetical protein